MGKMLSFEAIMAANDLPVKEVEVPEWGGAVKVQGLTKAQQTEIRKKATIVKTVEGDGGEEEIETEVNGDLMETLMLVECLVEPKVTVEQAEALKQKNAGAVDRVLMAVMDVAGLSPKAQKKAAKSFRTRVK